MAAAARCPRCHQSAPIVLRGVEAFCTVCGERRTPLAASILNLTGQPERIGGIAARVFGWGALGVGLFAALTVGLVVQAVAAMFVTGTWLGWAVGIPIGIVAVTLGLFGILGGRRLGRAGATRLAKAQLDAIRRMARHRRGAVTASDVGRALGIDATAADALLSSLARDPNENVSVDVVGDEVTYMFGSADAIRWRIRAEAAGIDTEEREALESELRRLESDPSR